MHMSFKLLALLLLCNSVSAAIEYAVQHETTLQTRQSRIKSYSMVVTCVAQQSTLLLRQNEASSEAIRK